MVGNGVAGDAGEALAGEEEAIREIDMAFF
jgi:hypothetical protein